MPTNLQEISLESKIAQSLANENGYIKGNPSDYSVEYAVDEKILFEFLDSTQRLALEKYGVYNDPKKRALLLTKLRDAIAKRGIVDVLRDGLKIYPIELTLFYQSPTPGNDFARELYEQNVFSITRQLKYSRNETQRALDLCLFVNGLPLITFELKNEYTKQTVEDAVTQYQLTRDPRETLLNFKRCLVHFAVDTTRVKFCTRLAGKDSWFLPFDKGCNGGAGNPINPNGVMTDYLWKDILSKPKLTRIIERYAALETRTDPKTKQTRERLIFPRYHQFDAVEKLLADVQKNGVGRRYLIQHSAGSGKSNSIAWLTHQLIDLKDENGKQIVDTALVVTDRVVLDRQIRDTIRQFAQVNSIVCGAQSSGDLRKAINDGKRIVVTTIEKFPFILDDVGTSHKDRRFAIIIDEAHSSQGGRTAAKMNVALSGESIDEEDDLEDKINKLCETRRLLPNASYFAFTATPKNKTLETFGDAYDEDGKRKHRPFHVYTMKQAIQEGFILDVLANYTTVDSYYRIVKRVEGDPNFDKRKSQKKLHAYVEGLEYTIDKKAALMVEHFLSQVIGKRKIDGKARAMVVTADIKRCIDYYYAVEKELRERKSPYRSIVAFSGEKEYGGATLTSAGLNGFSDTKIPETIRQDPYRILIVADMFQTGYDEPLLHTMYVDKKLADIKAVQTLSRLNRARPQKHDVCVLDFANKQADIVKAFSRYYLTTLLADETDPDKLYELEDALESCCVYSQDQINSFVKWYLEGRDRDVLEPIIDECVACYKDLETADQVGFKSDAKKFVRIYGFLGSILPYAAPAWEKLSIFLNFLIPKLPSPPEDDFTVGLLDAVDLDSYRLEAQASMKLALPDEDAEIEPIQVSDTTGKPDPKLAPVSEIVAEFNDVFGEIEWEDADRVIRDITVELPRKVLENQAYVNAMQNSDEQNARIEGDKALRKAILSFMKDNVQLYKQFADNPQFRNWLCERIFETTYRKAI